LSIPELEIMGPVTISRERTLKHIIVIFYLNHKQNSNEPSKNTSTLWLLPK